MSNRIIYITQIPKLAFNNQVAGFFRVFLIARNYYTLAHRQLLSILVLMLASGLLDAAPLLLTQLPAGSLISKAGLLQETGLPLTLTEARAQQDAGQFRPGTQNVLNSGIGSKPVWVHLELTNPTTQPVFLRLIAGTTWLDHLDVHIVHNGKVSDSWYSGDDSPNAFGLTAAIGFSFPVRFAPGHSDLYLRAEAIDPLVLPIHLITEAQAASDEHFMHYSYGFFYGFIFALLAYNGMLFAGLRERSHLYYSLYLASLILLSLAYTGHGYAWIWQGHPLIQRYVILVLMMLFIFSGLLFASRFLALAEHAPRVRHRVQLFALSGGILMVICLAIGSQLGAALVAFSYMTLFTLGMVSLGILTVQHGRPTGRYFLAAAIGGMLGTISTTLSVWGWLPFNTLTYHALEFGIALEATLLALALAYQMRHYQQSGLRAEHLARIDHLTSLHNRRAFFELSRPVWGMVERTHRPLSLIMTDLDYFKQVNDLHGHEAGDRALIAIAHLLSQACRNGDILARWGGEEFLLLLPETNLEQAEAFAERIRQSIEVLRLPITPGTLKLTASFGVVQHNQQTSIEELILEADQSLYAAKQKGRNTVFCAHS